MISNLNPRLLSDRNIEKVLEAAYSILENTGAYVYYDKAVELLVANGCTADGIHVKIPKTLVKKCIESAPKGIQLYDRDGNESILLKGRNVYFGGGPTCCNFFDPYTGERRPPQKGDAAKAALVTDALPNIDFVMSLCMIADETPVLADVHEVDAMLRNTKKPIATWAFNGPNLDKILQMFAAVAGGVDKLREKPNVVIYNEPTTPLKHTKEAMEKMFVTSKYGVPALYTPGMIMGGTAPSTIAGALAVGLADEFVGLVVSQLLSPGTPFIGGTSGSPMDMQTMTTPYGAPCTSLLLGASNEVHRYLGIPSFDMAGATESKTVDAQAGIEATLEVMVSLLTGGNLVHDCGFMDCGLTGSLAMLVLDDEIIGMAKRTCRGVEIDDERIGLDVIDEVGPGGNFLQSLHTMEYFRDEFYFPSLIDRRGYEAWEADGKTTMGDRAAKKAVQILETHKVDALPDSVLKELDRLVAEAESTIKK